MKYRKIIFTTSLFALFLLCHPVFAQSKSKEVLGDAIVKSILNNDLAGFKSLLLPRDVALKFQMNHDPEGTDQEVSDSLLAQYEAAYDEKVIPRHEKNFSDMVSLNKAGHLNWSHLNFMILYKAASKEEEYIPFFIHTKLNNSAYSHFYFDAVRYKGAWYLSGNMEVTKDEKYALK